MKKMMIALFAGMLALAANAGKVTWGLTGQTDYAGYIAYLYTDITGIAEAIEAGTFDGSGALASKTVNANGALTQANIGSYQNEDVTLYTVMFDAATVADANNYLIAGPVTKHFAQTGNQTFNFNESFSNVSFTPVPEPTAIALLMLGVAAAGLKRRV